MKSAVALVLLVAASAAWAESQVTMTMVDEKGIGTNIGTVTASDSTFGLVLTPALKSLAPGLHGFHVHQNPSCGPREADAATLVAG